MVIQEGFLSGNFEKKSNKPQYNFDEGYKRVNKIRKSKLYHYILPGLVFIFLIWSIISTGFNLTALIEGYPYIIDFLAAMFPPAWDKFVPMLKPAVETIQMAFLGTFFSVVLSIPVAIFGASNITSSNLL
jgi:phosphonate transport system permease protein